MHRIKLFVLFLMLLAFPVFSFAQECDVNFVNDALARVANQCRDTGRNQICLGNLLVDVTPAEDIESIDFSDVGDIEDITNISTLGMSEFNPETGDWGVAIMNAQANIENTLPGQNIMFLIFGNVNFNVEGVDQETGLQAFSITTGIGRTLCNEVPQDGMVIQTNSREPVEFMLNGTQVRLGSTAFVTTSEESITIGLFEGHSWITNLGVTEEMGAGSQIETPYDGVPRVKTDFVYYQDPALNNVWNWADSMYFTGQTCQVEIFGQTPVWNGPGRSVFRYINSGNLDVIGKYRNGDIMSWQIDKSQVDGGFNALQLWVSETNPTTFSLGGDCENVPDTQPNVPRVVPTTAPQVYPTTVYLPEATEEYYTPHFAAISAAPTNLAYSETCTTITVQVFHANSASLYISYYDASADVTVDQYFYFDLCDVPTGEHYLNLVVEDLGGNIYEYYYVITRAEP